VVFEGNRVLGTDESAIFAVGVDGLTIKSNLVEGACRRGQRPNGREAIRVQDCARVEVTGNTVDPARQGTSFHAAVLVTPATAVVP
jgi:hypothetical protein